MSHFHKIYNKILEFPPQGATIHLFMKMSIQPKQTIVDSYNSDKEFNKTFANSRGSEYMHRYVV